MDFQPTHQMLIFMIFFVIIYLFVLIRNVSKNSIDLYDFILLSAVAIVPACFVFLPSVFVKLTRMMGVEFPFFVLFGLLFFVVFVYLYRLVLKSYHNHNMIVKLMQEISILNEKLDRKNKDSQDKKIEQ